MGKLLDIIINWLWQNFLQAIFAKLDRWDVLFLSVLSLTGGLFWYYVTRFNFSEKLLWVALLIALGLTWLTLRKIPWRSSFNVRKLRVPFLLIKICLILLLAAGWAYARHWVYRIPVFPPAVTGFYVARFEDDPNDQNQSRIVFDLEDTIRRQGLLDEIKVERLPRIATENDAQQFGEEGGAALVLWGQVFDNKLRAYLTIVNGQAIFQAKSTVGGSGFSRDLPKVELPPELPTLQKVLAHFFVGYSFYHQKNYQGAKNFFELAKTDFPPTTREQDGFTPGKATLGTVHFYKGNTDFFLNDIDQAIVEYKAAVELTSRPGDNKPFYIEPLNNLAFLELQKRNTGDAVSDLARALDACGNQASMVCVSVSYNLGSGYIDQRDYEKAISAFESAITRFHSAEASSGRNLDKRLLASAHQYLAYSYVKMADSLTSDQSAQYKKADQELDHAISVLKEIEKVDETSPINLIRARIHVGLGQYDSALKILKEVKVTGPNEATMNLLFAVSYKCKGDVANSAEYMNRFRPPDPSETQEGFEYFNKLTGICRGE
jgi:tetratricopeptide (TPR) repeat protein